MSKLTDLIATPIYSTNLPSTGEIIKFRPYVVSEERALLMAQESENNEAMLNTLDSVIRSCIVFPKKVPRLSTFDAEFLFVQIRTKSVDENSMLNFTCNSCAEQVPIAVPLLSVYVDKSKSVDPTIKLDDSLAVILQYPTISDITEGKGKGVAASLKSIFKGDTVYNADDFTEAEITEFFDNLLPAQFAKVQEFFDNIPRTRIDVKWKCPKCGHDHNQILTGINSFF
jgi:DNA-directed RNA polymerase subunit M/transcription elongation factor TFIIS